MNDDTGFGFRECYYVGEYYMNDSTGFRFDGTRERVEHGSPYFKHTTIIDVS